MEYVLRCHQQLRSPWCLPPERGKYLRPTTSIPSSIATPPLLVTRDWGHYLILSASSRGPMGCSHSSQGCRKISSWISLKTTNISFVPLLNGLSADWTGAMTANTRIQTCSTWKYAFYANIFVNIKGEIVPFWRVWLHNFDILWRLHV